MSVDSNIGSVGSASAKENHLVNFIKDNATLIALIVLVIGLSFADDAFFTARNLSNLSRQVTIIGIIAVGMTMVILIAGIDLSVGSVVGLAAVVCTLLMQYGILLVKLSLITGFCRFQSQTLLKFTTVNDMLI